MLKDIFSNPTKRRILLFGALILILAVMILNAP
jgi:hypothetical protein